MSGATTSKTELFARLAEGHAARLTVVTPNRRLAQALEREFDALQRAGGRVLWDAPDILPYPAFVERAYTDALYSELAGDIPRLLTPAQEQALWEDVIGRSEAAEQLLALPQAAAAACDAWQLAHVWNLLPQLRRAQHSAALSEDASAFAGWAQHYERRTQRERCTDRARLPHVVIGVLHHAAVKKPRRLVCYGFDILAPQQRTLLDALAACGGDIVFCGPDKQDGSVRRVACADAREEIRRAARWARARLEGARADPTRPEDAREGRTPRIGVVMIDLARQRNAARRIFTQTMQPAAQLPGAAPTAHAPPFNISLGEPLSAAPLVNAAFLVLELAGREMRFERASLLIRSPFLAAGDAEMAARARFDAVLREQAEPVVTLDRLLAIADRNSRRHGPPGAPPVLAQKLAELAEFRKTRLFGVHSPAEWGRAFSAALVLMGFPGERTLDSTEYQTLKKLHEVLAQYAGLERVVAKMGYGEAVARLRRMATDTLFQPESTDVPIQVLGFLEAAGMQFDHLWVMGLSDDAWPLSPRPHPFLPIELQRAARLPNASAAESLALAQRLTAGWLACAGEVVLSQPPQEGEPKLFASPLLAGIAAGGPEASAGLPPAAPAYRDAIHASRRLVRSEDAQGPALVITQRVHGGTALIRDQAACPFRAYARHRLGAGGLAAPHAGLDAMERGTLVHRLLAAAWSALRTKQNLDNIGVAELAALLAGAADAAVAQMRSERPAALAGRFAQIEKRRLAGLAREWMDFERGRADFSVMAIEDPRVIAIGSLAFSARLDRVDQSADGERIVIDYKTNAPGPGTWLGERIEEPQLPLYLLAAEPQAQAIAFAQVKAGDMRFTALAAGKDVLPGARTLPDARLKRAADSWEEQRKAWRVALERLVGSFAAGEAAVDPLPRACEHCDLQPLCRIHARETGPGEEDGA